MIHVNDLMSTKVFTLHSTDSLHDVRTLMKLASIRHIPVTDMTNTFVGLLTHRDLLAHTISRLAEIDEEEQAEIEGAISVANIMRTDVITTTPTTPLSEAAEILYRNKYGCLPVLDKNRKLVGIITEADFLRLAIVMLHQEQA